MRKFILMTGSVTKYAGTGAAGAVDGNRLGALFKNPLGIAINQDDGNIYVSDYGNHKIRKISPEGLICYAVILVITLTQAMYQLLLGQHLDLLMAMQIQASSIILMGYQ